MFHSTYTESPNRFPFCITFNIINIYFAFCWLYSGSWFPD